MRNDELTDLFEPLRRAEPPSDLFDRIAARVPREAPTGPRWTLRIAAGLVGFIGVFPLTKPRTEEPPTPFEPLAHGAPARDGLFPFSHFLAREED